MAEPQKLIPYTFSIFLLILNFILLFEKMALNSTAKAYATVTKRGTAYLLTDFLMFFSSYKHSIRVYSESHPN